MAGPAIAKTMIPPEGSEQSHGLTPGPQWTSFEQFRKGGSEPQAVDGGAVGVLLSKSGVYRILRDEDYQRLIGLASEVDRIRGSLTMLARAAEVVRENPSSAAARQLLQYFADQWQGGTAPPVRRGHEPWKPEPVPLEPDDEPILDAAELGEPAEKS
jgi:hypothetical protein